MSSWKRMFGQTVSADPVKPGVWKKKEGGYFVRARVKVRGTLKEIRKVLPDGTSAEAYVYLQARIQEARGEKGEETERPYFRDYGPTVFRRKVETGEIRSAATERRWNATLKNYLLPAFGDWYMDEIKRNDVMEWRDAMARRVTANQMSPRTAESQRRVLLCILRVWVQEADADHDPAARVKPFDGSLHRVYTREQPNSLQPDEVRVFLAMMLRLYPHYFAMAALGFATGLRTCSLRPLRRQGPHADILWEEGLLLNRRSHTEGIRIMERTKTGVDQEIALPADVMAILRWHVEHLPEGPMQDSEYLFPDWGGGLPKRHALWQAVRNVTKAVGLPKRFTPHGMRRTNKDLLRAAGASQVVSMAISGHLTEQMHQHYSTVSASEQRESIAKLTALTDLACLLKNTTSGVAGGVEAPWKRRVHHISATAKPKTTPETNAPRGRNRIVAFCRRHGRAATSLQPCDHRLTHHLRVTRLAGQQNDRLHGRTRQ